MLLHLTKNDIVDLILDLQYRWDRMRSERVVGGSQLCAQAGIQKRVGGDPGRVDRDRERKSGSTAKTQRHDDAIRLNIVGLLSGSTILALRPEGLYSLMSRHLAVDKASTHVSIMMPSRLESPLWAGDLIYGTHFAGMNWSTDLAEQSECQSKVVEGWIVEDGKWIYILEHVVGKHKPHSTPWLHHAGQVPRLPQRLVQWTFLSFTAPHSLNSRAADYSVTCVPMPPIAGSD